jgi:hypothetical protein
LPEKEGRNMSRRDAGTIFSQAQLINAISVVSTNYIDFFDSSHQIDQAVKAPILHVRVNQGFVGCNFLSVFFQDAPPAAGSLGANAVPGTFELTAIQILNIPVAALFPANDLINIQIPKTGGVLGISQVPYQPMDTLSDSPLQRFVRFLYTTDIAPTAGSLDAWLDVL